jgi:hypothetical protein
MPSCKDITEHSSDYLDRNLPWWRRLGFWVHLLICVHCRRYLDQLKLTISSLGKTPDATPPVVEEQQVQDIVKHIQQHVHKDTHHS